MQDPTGGCQGRRDGIANSVDPFAPDELESSRLPRVVDEWVVRQIKAGKTMDEIKKMVTVTEEEKAEVRSTCHSSVWHSRTDPNT